MVKNCTEKSDSKVRQLVILRIKIGEKWKNGLIRGKNEGFWNRKMDRKQNEVIQKWVGR